MHGDRMFRALRQDDIAYKLELLRSFFVGVHGVRQPPDGAGNGSVWNDLRCCVNIFSHPPHNILRPCSRHSGLGGPRGEAKHGRRVLQERVTLLDTATG